jgi:hypothetical protein
MQSDKELPRKRTAENEEVLHPKMTWVHLHKIKIVTAQQHAYIHTRSLMPTLEVSVVTSVIKVTYIKEHLCMTSWRGNWRAQEAERLTELRAGRQGGSSLLHNGQTGSGVHPHSYTMGTGGRFLGVKRQGREADHSPPSSVEVISGGGIAPLRYTSSWLGA